MSLRDPDLGRDRTTAALGRRDWGWFSGTEGVVPADREAGQAPWGSTRHVTTHDRFDRTLGIPARRVPMWPIAETLPFDVADPVARVQAMCAEILAEPAADRVWPDRERSIALLTEIVPSMYGRNETAQRARVADAARRLGIDPATAVELAGGVGSLIAQTTHRKPGTRVGAARFNMLADAQIPDAVELFLARDQTRQAQANSDPDLPRMWMLANGLTHGTPVSVMRRVPARSVGPAAQIVPLHDDLLDWRGMRIAVEHMAATVTAAATGRRWLAETASLAGPADTALALGVIALTRPTTALELTLVGVAHVSIERARHAAGAPPAGVLDLSDQALKAMCDRNGWLLGSPSERTQRELVQRSVPADAGVAIRQRLAAGDRDALAGAITAQGPDDDDLDRRAFRKNPVSPDVTAAHGLLRAASAEALARFADFEYEPRAGYADAFAHRFPAQMSRGPLTETDPDRLLIADRELTDPDPARPLTFELGL